MRFCSLALLIALVMIGLPAQAQPATAPSIIGAEQTFDRGLRSFRSGDFSAARSSFERVIQNYDFNQRTTAAHLMAGKALLAMGDADRVISEMTTFISSFPRSRYVDSARQLRRAATNYLREAAPTIELTELGVLLPLSPADINFSQALFNGIRLAVDDHNDAFPEAPIRLVFRDTGGSTATAAAAVEGLARQGVEVVIGPLYSEEADAAGRVAERERVVLLSPLATEAHVSQGRQYVFQANPTFEARGRAMAAFADNQLLRRVGLVSVQGTFGETMAHAFADEAPGRGIEVVFSVLLPSSEGWYQLAERVGADQFLNVDAVYFPVAGASADDEAAAALRGLEAAVGEGATRPRVLGNSGWQNLRASRGRAEQFGAVFTSNFYTGSSSSALRSFESRYLSLAGHAPDRLAFMGFDLTSKLLSVMDEGRLPSDLPGRLREARHFEGLAHGIDFRGTQVNQSLYYMRFRGESVELVR